MTAQHFVFRGSAFRLSLLDYVPYTAGKAVALPPRGDFRAQSRVDERAEILKLWACVVCRGEKW